MNWLMILILIIIVLILLYFFFCRKKAPSSQVTNNSNTLFLKVKIADVEFTENLNMCGEGCSTGFIDVPEGSNTISLLVEEGDSWIELGSLGPFEKGKLYAVNVKHSGSYCAELWWRHQGDTTFNQDTSKELVASNCS